MDKPWLNSYQAGMPAEIDINQHSSVVDIFNTATAQFSENASFTNFGKTISYKPRALATCSASPNRCCLTSLLSTLRKW